MRVSVQYGADGIPGQGLLETTASEIRENFERLAFDGGSDGRVVEQRDAVRRPQASKRALELECFVHCLSHEQLDDFLSPRTERTSAKSTGKAFHAGEADALNLGRIAIEYGDAGVGQDLPNLVALA